MGTHFPPILMGPHHFLPYVFITVKVYAGEMPAERSIVNSISRWLKSEKIWHFKVHGSAFQRAGIPDIVGCCRGRFFGLEAKRPGEKPSKIQQYEMKRLDNSGAFTAVVCSVADAKNALVDFI